MRTGRGIIHVVEREFAALLVSIADAETFVLDSRLPNLTVSTESWAIPMLFLGREWYTMFLRVTGRYKKCRSQSFQQPQGLGGPFCYALQPQGAYSESYFAALSQSATTLRETFERFGIRVFADNISVEVPKMENALSPSAARVMVTVLQELWIPIAEGREPQHIC